VTARPDGPAVGICLDKGYDYAEVRDLCDEWRLTPHIRSRGEEKGSYLRIRGS